MTVDVNRGRSEFPRERDSFRRIIDRAVAALRRRSFGAVDQMDLVTEIIILVVTDFGAIGQTERLALLLTDHNARRERSRAIALRELIRIGISLDRRAEILSRHEAQILDVVSIEGRGFCAGRRLRNLRQAVPSNTLGVGIVFNREQNAMVYTGFVQSFARLVPNDSTHVVKSSF